MRQKGFRTLFFWVIWAATALVVMITLYGDTDVLWFLKRDPTRITWVIMGLFLLSVLSSFILVIALTHEFVRTVEIEDRARESGLFGIEVKSRKRAVDRFFGALQQAMKSGGEIELETLLHIELNHYQRISHFVGVMGNLLITLGLIGTVVGLTLTLTGLTGALDALGNDQEMLLRGLRKAMGGMGAAFYTTLLGAVLGGVLLRIFTQITEHGIESVNDTLLKVCMVYCSADLRASPERDTRALKNELTALAKNLESVEKIFVRSTHALSGFREEMLRLKSLSAGNNETESLRDVVKQQHAYCELLKKEILMINAVNSPWRTRFTQWFRKLF